MAYLLTEWRELIHAKHPDDLFPKNAIHALGEALGETADPNAVNSVVAFLQQVADEYPSFRPSSYTLESYVRASAEALQRLNDPRAVVPITRFLRAMPGTLPWADAKSVPWKKGTAETFVAALESLVKQCRASLGEPELAGLRDLPEQFEFETPHFDIYDSNSDSYVSSGATRTEIIDCSAPKLVAVAGRAAPRE